MGLIPAIRREAGILSPLVSYPELDITEVQNNLNYVLSSGVNSLQRVFEMAGKEPIHSTDDRVKAFTALVSFGRYIETCRLNTSSGTDELQFSDELTIAVEDNDENES